MKRLLFLPLFSASAELFSPSEDNFSLLHSMVLTPTSTPYKTTHGDSLNVLGYDLSSWETKIHHPGLDEMSSSD